MNSKTMIALSAVLVLGMSSAATAQQRTAPKQPPAAAAQARALLAGSLRAGPIGYDSGGAAVFAEQLTRTCTLAMKEQSRC